MPRRRPSLRAASPCSSTPRLGLGLGLGLRLSPKPKPKPNPNPNVLLDAQGQFCALHKPGGAPLSPELIARSVAAAQQHMPAYAALCNGD